MAGADAETPYLEGPVCRGNGTPETGNGSPPAYRNSSSVPSRLL